MSKSDLSGPLFLEVDSEKSERRSIMGSNSCWCMQMGRLLSSTWGAVWDECV